MLDQKTDQIKDQDFAHLTENSYEQLLIAAETDAAAKVKMWQAINKLTPMQRESIKLKFFDDLSYEAILQSHLYCNLYAKGRIKGLIYFFSKFSGKTQRFLALKETK
ncbi:RNA polymerase sigma factor [Pedobacter jamesrossensis]|uniref:RNA polymerase sigma-70 factor, ECF subfamily n=1 Tax=Pedobacter jamesrossensis TaxID=1908238 RepID=A0ABV8NPV8_9SPHI